MQIADAVDIAGHCAERAGQRQVTAGFKHAGGNCVIGRESRALSWPVIPGRCDSIEPGISRFRVWSFGPSRNDNSITPRRDARR
ncbi:hypothetical protein E3H11_41405 [Bradyrhizobium brasilense]|nr:hypothetical protein [Bradyrhizobium brasilense]